jgi:hypothetical protein
MLRNREREREREKILFIEKRKVKNISFYWVIILNETLKHEKQKRFFFS